MERRSGILRIGPVINARLEIKDGRILRAMLEGAETLAPSDRLYKILDANLGRFEFLQGEVNVTDEIGISISNAILEHARRCDEGT